MTHEAAQTTLTVTLTIDHSTATTPEQVREAILAALAEWDSCPIASTADDDLFVSDAR